MTQGEMLKIREVIRLWVPVKKEADNLIREIELALDAGQAASRPGYKGALT